ncbi:MAG TPA: MipA/OmpV family protein [Gammaproteobacteria bacterium]|nr:MipA/OmpV family protein [Gammaproteobacteria bacterium]
MTSGEKLRLWEAGVGIALVMFPDYRGPNQQSAYVLPLPYFIYRGERLKVDYNGSRGVLFDTKRLHLDSGINASVPVKSDDPMRAAAYRTSTPRSSLGRCSNTI